MSFSLPITNISFDLLDSMTSVRDSKQWLKLTSATLLGDE
jgi:hypothetical protein